MYNRQKPVMLLLAIYSTEYIQNIILFCFYILSIILANLYVVSTESMFGLTQSIENIG